MLAILQEWYRRYLSDPQAVYLALLLLLGFSVVIFTGAMLLPVFAGIVIAYLLDGGVQFLERRGSGRGRAVILVFMVFMAVLVFVLFGLVPLLTRQVVEFMQELPSMLTRGQQVMMRLPELSPYIDEEQVRGLIAAIGTEVRGLSHTIVTRSITSLSSVITLIMYLVLMPLLVFFFLKDKWLILGWFDGFLPKERSLMNRVWADMDKQLGNYVRGKFWEIIIVAFAGGVTFSIMGLNYALLLGALVGLSVVVPYVGAVVVTFPVLLVALFQWGWGPEFAYLVTLYLVVQALDGVVLVPLMFSEVTNLHPIAIIVAVLTFGGIWGFWGVFFAIPLATLVQALLVAWPRVYDSPPAPG